MKNIHKSSGISFRWDDLAVPEILTGITAYTDELLDDECEEPISYENLALPEIHYSSVSRSASRGAATA